MREQEGETRRSIPLDKVADQWAMEWCENCQVFHLAFKREGRLICAADVPLDDVLEAVSDAGLALGRRE